MITRGNFCKMFLFLIAANNQDTATDKGLCFHFAPPIQNVRPPSSYATAS